MLHSTSKGFSVDDEEFFEMDEYDEGPTVQKTMGFIAQQAAIRTNPWDYLASGVATLCGVTHTLASFFDMASDLLGAHANHVRGQQDLRSFADILAAETKEVSE